MDLEEKVVIVVDNSNVFIEGQKFSAKKKGILKDDADTRDPQDPSWRVDFGNLLTTVAKGRLVSHAILVGSRPPQNDSVWDAAKKYGFTVTVHERNAANKENGTFSSCGRP